MVENSERDGNTRPPDLFLEKHEGQEVTIRTGHGKRNLVGYTPWGCKESDTTEAI